ncbi:MAG: ABC transporter permease subunit, partial [Alphaproteobacteria bacterium]|nr:ABC transporter permease subunit [Alphaproteobacteria bacterium]
MTGAWRRFGRNRLAAVGGALLVVLGVVAVAAPLVATDDPYANHEAQLAAPGSEHWLGTDDLARDVYSRVIYGTRISLRVAVSAVAMAMAAGVGLVAGLFGGWVDTVLSRLTDIMFALPEVLLALVVVAILGQGLGNVTLAIALVYTPIFARVTRGAVLRVMAEPYVEAARALGYGWWRLAVRHVLPNALGPVIVQATLSLAFAI